MTKKVAIFFIATVQLSLFAKSNFLSFFWVPYHVMGVLRSKSVWHLNDF